MNKVSKLINIVNKSPNKNNILKYFKNRKTVNRSKNIKGNLNGNNVNNSSVNIKNIDQDKINSDWNKVNNDFNKLFNRKSDNQ